MAELTDVEKKSLEEIPHPSLPEGSSIYGGTKVFPDLQAENGESYFTLVHGIAHESSVSFVAVLQATRALRKGFRVKEIPIRFVDRQVGGSKMSRTIVLEAIWKVPLIRLAALGGRL